MCGKKELPFLFIFDYSMKIWFDFAYVRLLRRLGSWLLSHSGFSKFVLSALLSRCWNHFRLIFIWKTPVREWNCFGWTRCVSVFLWKRKVGGGCFRISVPWKSCFPLCYLVAEAVFRFIFYLKASWRIGVASVWPVAVPVFPWEKNGWN